VGLGDSAAVAAARVVEKITEVRTDLEALGYDLLIGTSETGGNLDQTMVDVSDFVFANIHPWWAASTPENAATFANDAFVSTLAMGVASPRNTVMFQGELGWPSDSDTVGEVNGAGSPAAIPELQTVLDGWVCPALVAETPYFWFSAFDEPWKATTGFGVEPYWGLFNADGTLKDITIPDCTV